MTDQNGMKPMTIDEIRLLLGDKEILIQQLIREIQSLRAQVDHLAPKEEIPSKKKGK